MKLLLVIACVLVCACAQNDGTGFPVANCPQGEHSVLYCPQKAEPSCDNPTVHDKGSIAPCGIPQCFCNTPTVRNEKTGKCVNLKDCPKKTGVC